MKAFAALPAITSSTACTAPPAARNAASKLPGDIVVSASSPSRPSFGVASRMGVTQRDGLERGGRGLDAHKIRKALVAERPLDRAQAIGPFGMAGGREVFEAGGVGDEKRGHQAIRKR